MEQASIFAIDVSGEAVSGVAIAVKRRSITVVSAHRRQFTDIEHVDDALREVVDQCGAPGQRCLVSLDGAWFRHRTLHVPFTDIQKIRRVLPYELEDSLSWNGQPFVYDFVAQQSPDGSGTHIVAVMLAEETVRRWLERLQVAGVDPDVLTVAGPALTMLIGHSSKHEADEFAVLHIGLHSAQLIQARHRKIVVVRQLAGLLSEQEGQKRDSSHPDTSHNTESLQRLMREVDNTLLALDAPGNEINMLPLYLTGSIAELQKFRTLCIEHSRAGLVCTDWQVCPEFENTGLLSSSGPPHAFEQALALAWCSAREHEQFNLRKDSFAKQNHRRRLRRRQLSAFLGITVAIILVVMIVDYQYLRHQRDRLSEQLATLYRQTIPGTTTVRDPLRELQVKVKELQTAGGGENFVSSPSVVAILADISRRIPASLYLSIERLLCEDRSVRIRGTADSFNTVDQARQSLAQSRYFSEVIIGTATISPEDQLVRFELTCNR